MGIFKGVNKKQFALLFLGVAFFIYIIYNLGGSTVDLIRGNFNFGALKIYLFFTVISFVPFVWRWQIILSGYGHKISFFKLLKMQLAGFAIGYVTPSARVGGEPMRVYMLKQDEGVDYKTGTVSVILDKYMEFMGTVTFAIFGLLLLYINTGIDIRVRQILLGAILVVGFLLWIFYYRLSRNKSVFLSMFSVFLSKQRLKKVSKNLSHVDFKLTDFIVNHKKEFFLSYFFYIFSAIIFLMEFKYLLLALGIEVNLIELMVVLITVGVASYVPLPMALGSMEAGQSGIFQLLRGDPSIGLAMSLIQRVRALFFTAIGFIIIIKFGGKGFFKENNIGK